MDRLLIKKDWIELSHGWDFRLKVERAGYFDERPQIIIQATSLLCILVLPAYLLIFGGTLWMWGVTAFLSVFGWGRMFISLPYRTGINACESDSFGFYYYSRALWFCWKTDVYAIHMPYDYEWVRTSYLLKESITKKDQTNPLETPKWIYATRDNRLSLYRDEYKEVLWSYSHYPYTYTLPSGTIQEATATITVSEREWRWKCLTWLPWFAKVRRSIEVKFDREMGSRAGSWKGGVVGCGYDLKTGETPQECLLRMEKERKFR